MEPLLPIVVAAGVFYTFVLVARRRRSRIEAWHRAAAAARLEDVRAKDAFGAAAFLEGRSGALRVRLEPYRHGKYEYGTRLVIQGLARLSIRREGVATAFEKRFLGETEIELGSPGFDERCFVSGSPALACAVLDAETRGRLASALAGHLRVNGKGPLGVRASLSEGTLRLECRDGWNAPGERVSELLRGSLDLARRLVLPPDLPLRIAERLPREPEPGVRRVALLTLAREYPDNPATRPALLTALQDESAEVRLRAAMTLGEAGRETLLALVASEATEDGCAARAVAALGEHLSDDQATQALRRALDSGHAETALACVSALSERPAGMAEGTLLSALSNARSDVRVAAARALGRVGSAAAVRELLMVSERAADLRGPARQAIAEIQARLPGASPGQLSLAGGAAGALSLAGGEVEAGALSLVEAADDPETPARAAAQVREHE